MNNSVEKVKELYRGKKGYSSVFFHDYARVELKGTFLIVKTENGGITHAVFSKKEYYIFETVDEAISFFEMIL